MTAPTPEGLRDTLTRALARIIYRSHDPAPHILRICEPWADELLPVVQAALAELTQTLRAVEIDRDEWRDRAHAWRTAALAREEAR